MIALRLPKDTGFACPIAPVNEQRLHCTMIIEAGTVLGATSHFTHLCVKRRMETARL